MSKDLMGNIRWDESKPIQSSSETSSDGGGYSFILHGKRPKKQKTKKKTKKVAVELKLSKNAKEMIKQTEENGEKKDQDPSTVLNKSENKEESTGPNHIDIKI